jgi:3-phenylpropionate/cinnamic acid dioxygenase small subunit
MSATSGIDLMSASELVYHEARLIDEKRFDEWYELFADEALYWMPLSRDQPPGAGHTSLFYEDKLLLKVRIERLRHPNAFSQQQPSYCQHILQQPAVEGGEMSEGVPGSSGAPAASDSCVVRTPFLYVEAQLDNQLVLAGVAYHHLIRQAERWRIRMKKIELLNREAALPSIQLLL